VGTTGSSPARLALPQVTLCAVTSVNVAATVKALAASLAEIEFGACKLFSDTQQMPGHPDIALVPIPRLASAAAYSAFILDGLVDHVDTSHCLIVQWDGHVLDARRWQAGFLAHDYIGAVWPQFGDGHDVGNGGFSLRSRRLMALCRAPGFRPSHPEDVAIGRINRRWLEEQGMRFAPPGLAHLFSAERAGDPQHSFGFHGVWHMPKLLGEAAFWEIYTGLDDITTVGHDLKSLVKQIAVGPGGVTRALRLMADAVRGAVLKR
jgi:hypothetical protein